jgi:uncharacterized membrane protein
MTIQVRPLLSFSRRGGISGLQSHAVGRNFLCQSHTKGTNVSRIVNYFLKGIVFLAPLAITIYVCVQVFTTIDGWLGIAIPGVGFLVTVVLITLFGWLAQSFLTRGVLNGVESLLNRLPFVRLVYSSTRDLLDAFVGEKRRFDQPVLVTPYPGGVLRQIGFVTQESLLGLGLPGHVTVYLPFSYSIAGMVVIVPTSAITSVNADSAEVLAFIVSGGVTAPPGSLTAPPIVLGESGSQNSN